MLRLLKAYCRNHWLRLNNLRLRIRNHYLTWKLYRAKKHARRALLNVGLTNKEIDTLFTKSPEEINAVNDRLQEQLKTIKTIQSKENLATLIRQEKP